MERRGMDSSVSAWRRSDVEKGPRVSAASEEVDLEHPRTSPPPTPIMNEHVRKKAGELSPWALRPESCRSRTSAIRPVLISKMFFAQKKSPWGLGKYQGESEI